MFYVIVMMLTAPNGQNTTLDAVGRRHFATASECIAAGIERANYYGQYSHGSFVCTRHGESLEAMSRRHAPIFAF